MKISSIWLAVSIYMSIMLAQSGPTTIKDYAIAFAWPVLLPIAVLNDALEGK